MTDRAFQDDYPDDWSVCYGCGRLNEQGLHIQSRWDGEESVCTFQPRPYHTAIPGFVYGGLIASVIDCHATGTASAVAYRAANRPPGSDPPFRFVTAALHVDYLRPTPMGPPLELRATPKEVKMFSLFARSFFAFSFTASRWIFTGHTLYAQPNPAPR